MKIHIKNVHNLKLGSTDLKKTPLYDIEMNGFLEEAAILKHTSIENLYRLAEFHSDESE